MRKPHQARMMNRNVITFLTIIMAIALLSGRAVLIAKQLTVVVLFVIVAIVAIRLSIALFRNGVPIISDVIRLVVNGIRGLWNATSPLSSIRIEDVQNQQTLISTNSTASKLLEGQYELAVNRYPWVWEHITQKIMNKFTLTHEQNTSAAEVRFLKYINAIPNKDNAVVPKYLTPVVIQKLRFEYKRKYSTLDYTGSSCIVTIQEAERPLSSPEEVCEFHKFCFES